MNLWTMRDGFQISPDKITLAQQVQVQMQVHLDQVTQAHGVQKPVAEILMRTNERNRHSGRCMFVPFQEWEVHAAEELNAKLLKFETVISEASPSPINYLISKASYI